jgi:hypothetical protein
MKTRAGFYPRPLFFWCMECMSVFVNGSVMGVYCAGRHDKVICVNVMGGRGVIGFFFNYFRIKEKCYV